MGMPDDPDYFDIFSASDEAMGIQNLLAAELHLDPYAPNIALPKVSREEAIPSTLLQV